MLTVLYTVFTHIHKIPIPQEVSLRLFENSIHIITYNKLICQGRGLNPDRTSESPSR